MSGVSYIKKDLEGSPPWGIAWDPVRPYLYVGGGGGGGQKEVPNKLAVYYAGQRHAVEKVAELDVPDDSVSSLDVLATGPEEAVVFGGVNSPRGSKVNAHLRSYAVSLGGKKEGEKKKEEGSVRELGKVQLFQPSYSASEGFQRVTRLSRVRTDGSKSKRICAIASSLAPESEICVFNATVTTPKTSDLITRISPLRNQEANDLDIWEGEPGEFTLAYCTNNEVYSTPIHLNLGNMKPKVPLTEPSCIWNAPMPDAHDKRSTRPKYRSLRFLTADTAVLLANISGQSELHVLRIHRGAAEIILKKRLPRSAGSAVSMDVTHLDSDPQTGQRQVVVAVAAQKSDVHVYTIDISNGAFRPVFQEFTELTPFENTPMKAVRLSTFWPPSDSSNNKQQVIRLASISLSTTLVIDTLALLPLPKSRRHVLNKSSRLSSLLNINYISIAFMLIITAFLAQSYYAQKSGLTSTAPQLLPSSWQRMLDAYRERSSQMASPITRRVHDSSSAAGQKLLHLLHTHHRDTGHLPDPARKAIILSASAPDPDSDDEHAQLSTHVHDSTADVLKQDAGARKWEELSKAEQKVWRDKLKRAGAWSAEYGETIFKGVFFSEIAGAVGRAAAEVING